MSSYQWTIAAPENVLSRVQAAALRAAGGHRRLLTGMVLSVRARLEKDSQGAGSGTSSRLSPGLWRRTLVLSHRSSPAPLTTRRTSRYLCSHPSSDPRRVAGEGGRFFRLHGPYLDRCSTIYVRLQL